MADEDTVDAFRDQIFRILLTHMMGDPRTIQQAMSLILISRNLERIGDHATNIAEEIIYWIQGRDVRHQKPSRLPGSEGHAGGDAQGAIGSGGTGARRMSKGTILVIDDEKDLIELVRYNLEKEGYDVIAATDGQSGLEVIKRHRPELVVLDLMMPGIDGLQVCQRLRADQRSARMPVIMLTAKATEADRIVGLELGADDYITKPFSPREVVARVKAVLRRTAAQQESAAGHPRTAS